MFRRAGIRNYSIWQAGDTLFGYYECDDLQTALAVQKDAPVSARWRTYMRDVIRMERDPKSGAQPHLEQVFFFGCDTCTEGAGLHVLKRQSAVIQRRSSRRGLAGCPTGCQSARRRVSVTARRSGSG